jgi:hypothetical protein
MQLTVIPSGPSSMAATRVCSMTAAFDDAQ